MYKILFLISLSFEIFANNLIYVENYKLDVGRYKGQIYTGDINIDGYPVGNGKLMCSKNSKKIQYEAKFVDGVATEGILTKCANYISSIKVIGEYIMKYEGPFGDVENSSSQSYISGNKMSLTFVDNPYFSHLKGIYLKKSRGEHFIDGTIYGKDISTKQVTCKWGIPNYVQCYEGPLKWTHKEHSFEGFTKGGMGSEIEGKIIWKDGTEYDYMGKWDWDNIAKVKKRLDIVNKRNQKEKVNTKPTTPVEKIKSIKEYNPEVVIDDKKPSTKYEEKELSPINME